MGLVIFFLPPGLVVYFSYFYWPLGWRKRRINQQYSFPAFIGVNCGSCS
jgi:hypothetical protein